MTATAIATADRAAAHRQLIAERTERRIVDSAIDRVSDAIAKAFARPAA